MGVWIETIYPGEPPAGRNVTPCMGVWIETFDDVLHLCQLLGHTLYGCVDWNNPTENVTSEKWSHTLYGCVDWN